ncbi:MAG: hypothetical protein H0Z33_16585 [Bacillaceae bacterium]|nr:hypothetical protein [Bacillaceae bacterium]
MVKQRTSISIDATILSKAKQYAEKQGTPLSTIIEDALAAYLHATIPYHMVKTLKQELAELSASYHTERATNNALIKEIHALRKVNLSLTRTLDTYVKTVITAKKATGSIATTKQKLARREAILSRKAQELAEKEKYLTQKEQELKSLAAHLKEKERELLRREKLINIKLFSRDAPKWVVDLLHELNAQAIGMKDLLGEYDWGVIFGEDLITDAISQWEVISENSTTITRDAGHGLAYRHMKENLLQGFFVFKHVITIKPKT